jgi:hypothetical protein
MKMSNYRDMAFHPETGKLEPADFLDNHFGPHHYGVRFNDGRVFGKDEYVRTPAAQQAYDAAIRDTEERERENFIAYLRREGGRFDMQEEDIEAMVADLSGQYREDGE